MHLKTLFWGRVCRFRPTAKGVGGLWRLSRPAGTSPSWNNSNQSKTIPPHLIPHPLSTSGLWSSHSEQSLLNEMCALPVPSSSPLVCSSPTPSWPAICTPPRTLLVPRACHDLRPHRSFFVLISLHLWRNLTQSIAPSFPRRCPLAFRHFVLLVFVPPPSGLLRVLIGSFLSHQLLNITFPSWSHIFHGFIYLLLLNSYFEIISDLYKCCQNIAKNSWYLPSDFPGVSIIMFALSSFLSLYMCIYNFFPEPF